MQSEEGTLDRGEAFTRLLIANEKRIYGLIFALVPDQTAAQDILQEAACRLWKKFDSFEEGTNFSAWALRVTRYVVLEWQRTQKRVPLPMDEGELHDLADTYMGVQHQEPEPAIRAHLSECLIKLNDRQREILHLVYTEGHTANEAASLRGISRQAIHKMLRRTKDLLLDCIQRRTSLST